MSRKFCIIGESLKHTMSPPIHKRLFELSGKPSEYSVMEIPKDDFNSSIDKLNQLDGYNITIPYKVDIIPLINGLDKTAKRYGAVNCVYNKNGVSTGYNTDVYGFLRSLKSGGGNLGGKVVLLGCGGVGRMMAIEACLADSDLTIAVLKRSIPKAEKVAKDIKFLCPDTKVTITTLDNINGKFDLMINSTPVGMYPKSKACPVSDDIIKNVSCVFDAIYNPVETVLIKKAKSYGKIAIGGMAMLVWQAVVAHEIWDNASYKESDIKKLITEMEKQVERDFK